MLRLVAKAGARVAPARLGNVVARTRGLLRCRGQRCTALRSLVRERREELAGGAIGVVLELVISVGAPRNFALRDAGEGQPVRAQKIEGIVEVGPSDEAAGVDERGRVVLIGVVGLGQVEHILGRAVLAPVVTVM